VEKFIGDAVMAVWGAPTAHEDDAERAVRAALDLVDAVGALGPTIQARAGVLTGEAAVTLGATNQGMVAGDLVNTASRLQSVAQPGTVLVGEATQRAASKAIAFEEAGEHALKGKSAPVPAWVARRVVAQVGGRNRTETLEAPFVGRDGELRLLKDLFHATTREGRARLVSVIGPAGIGKTRLAWEFLKYVDGLVDTVWYHDGRSPAYGEGISFWALGEMVRRRAGLLETDDESTTRTRIAETLAQHVPDPEERRRIEPALLALLGIDAGPVNTDQLFGAWRTFFERLADTAPVVLVFEDFHFADPGLLDFVDHLLEWSRNAPIYVLTLARPELLEKRPDWGAGKRNFTSLYLEPLPEPAMRELLAGLVPGLQASAVRAIVERADGIPLYAVETVRMLLAEGKLSLDEGVYHPVGDLTNLAVPETLSALIASRLDGLAPADRALVSDAAVLGQSFTPAGLAAVSSIPEGELEPRLRALVRRELLTLETDPRSPERGQYAFVQALIREVAYNTLAKRDRKSRHLAAARFFESLGTDEIAGGLAGHYLAAYQNSPEGPEAVALAVQARIALVAAAERAAALRSHDQALRYFEQALMVTIDPADTAVLLERAGAAASAAGHHANAESLYRRSAEAYRALGDRAGEARTTASIASVMLNAGRVADAIAVLEPAADAFADLAGVPAGIALHAQLARAHFLAEHDQVALEWADRTIAAAERNDLVAIVADTLITKGGLLARFGRPHEGLALMEGALHLSEANDLPFASLRAYINLSAVLDSTDSRAASAIARAGLELARRLGLSQRAVTLVQNAASSSIRVGDWDWAVTESEEALTFDLDPESRLNLLSNLSDIRVMRGEPIQATIAEMEQLLAGRDEPGLASSLLDVRATAAFVEGHFPLARKLATEFARMSSLSAPAMWPYAARCALWSGDAAAAASDLDQLDATDTRGAMIEADRRTMRAGIAALEGRMADAAAGYHDAARRWRELGVDWDLALCDLDAVRFLGEADHRLSREAADEARQIFTRLGAKPFLARLEAAMDRPSRPASEPARARDASTV
jgi:tetratricopeptide (TPR) repeat protein